MASADSIFTVTTATRIDFQARTRALIVSLYTLSFPISLLTIFTELDLPEYESYEALRQQVLTAITAGSEYFGFA